MARVSPVQLAATPTMIASTPVTHNTLREGKVRLCSPSVSDEKRGLAPAELLLRTSSCRGRIEP
jgi:hypothetical protein